MPAGRLKPRCRNVCALIAAVFLLPASVETQMGGVTLRATVSETVALSVAPNSTHGDVRVDVASSGSTVRMTLSGDGTGTPVIRVPLIVRSNTGFRISGIFESKTAQLTQLSVTDVRATGSLVSAEAVNNLQISPEFDLRGLSSSKDGSSVLDSSSPFVVLSGPRVSLGGTLNSPNNALEITLLIRIKSESVSGWLAHLTFFND